MTTKRMSRRSANQFHSGKAAVSLVLQSETEGLTVDDGHRLDELRITFSHGADRLMLGLGTKLQQLNERGLLDKKKFLYSDTVQTKVGGRSLHIEVSFQLKVSEETLGLYFATKIQEFFVATRIDRLDMVNPGVLDHLMESIETGDSVHAYVQGGTGNQLALFGNIDGNADSPTPQLTSQEVEKDPPTGQYI